MTARLAAMAATVIASALALAACGLERPDPSEPPQEESVAAEPATDERPPPDQRDPDQYTSGPADAAVRNGDAAELAAAYGQVSGNWSWRTHEQQYERMLALAGGGLRRQLLSAPPDRGVLRTLRRQRQTNRAEVVSVDVHGDAVIVVLRERAGARGGLDTSPVHAVYRAEIGPTAVGPRVVSWERLP